jgi:ankyrin repeat protein
MSLHKNSHTPFQTQPLPYDGHHPDQQLIEAVHHNDLSKVQALLAQGANPNTLGMIAPYDESLVRKIPTGKKGTYIIEDDNMHTAPARVQGKTPLYVAVCDGYYDVAKALLQGGAHPDMPIEGGLCPLTIAVESRHDRKAFTNLLLDFGADPNVASPYGGGTAFAGAVSCGAEFNTVARMLNEGNADPRLKDNQQRDALDISNQRGTGLRGYVRLAAEQPAFGLLVMFHMAMRPSLIAQEYRMSRNDKRVRRAIKHKIKTLNKG